MSDYSFLIFLGSVYTFLGENAADVAEIKLTKDFLVDLSLTSEIDKKKIEKYYDHIESMLVLGEGETIVELGASTDDPVDKGLAYSTFVDF